MVRILDLLMTRYGALPIAAALGLTLSAFAFMRWDRGLHHKAGLLMAVVACLAALVALAPAASRSMQRLALSFSRSAPVPPAVWSASILLAGGAAPMSATLYLPGRNPGEGEQEGLECTRALDLAAPPPDTITRLILYLPSWGGARSENTLLLSELANMGFAVLAIDDVASGRLSSDAPLETEARAARFSYETRAAADATERLAPVRTELAVRQLRDALGRFSACVQTSATWRGAIDFNRIGVLGYSFGGGVGLQAASELPHIGAVANLDGTMFGAAAGSPPDTPLLWILGDYPTPTPEQLRSRRGPDYERTGKDLRMAGDLARRRSNHIFTVAGAHHNAFSDGYFDAATLRQRLLLNPAEAHGVIAHYVTSFFDCYLRGAGCPRLYAPRPPARLWRASRPSGAGAERN